MVRASLYVLRVILCGNDIKDRMAEQFDIFERAGGSRPISRDRAKPAMPGYEPQQVLRVLPKPPTYQAQPDYTPHRSVTAWADLWAVPLKQELKVLPGNLDKFKQIVIQVQNALSLPGVRQPSDK